MLVAMKAAETDRSDQNLDNLTKAASDWLAAYNGLSEDQKNDPATIRRKKNCEAAFKQARHLKLANKLAALGNPPWDQAKEDAAADIQMQVLFETGDKPMESAGDSTFGAKWIVSEDFATGKGQKNFVFKAAQPLPGDEPTEIPGFAPGSEPVREVLGDELGKRLKAQTGLDFNVPETRVVGIDGGKLDPGEAGKVYLGSAQAAAPTIGSVGGLKKSDPDIINKITPKSVQKAAIFDALAMNVDRHGNNFLVTPPGEDGTSELVPIDNGLAFPTRDGLEARRGRIAGVTAFKDIPAAYEPFDPEMLAAIDMIDENAIVDGLKDRAASVARRTPA